MNRIFLFKTVPDIKTVPDSSDRTGHDTHVRMENDLYENLR